MAKKMLIDATHPEETRVVVMDGQRIDEFDFESINKRQLAGNIYLAKVTRVEPSLQAAFVEYGGNRHGFLAFSEIHPDYYQIPVADREEIMAAEVAAHEEDKAEDEGGDVKEAKKPRPRRAPRSRRRKTDDAEKQETPAEEAKPEVTAEAEKQEAPVEKAEAPAGEAENVAAEAAPESSEAPAPEQKAVAEAPAEPEVAAPEAPAQEAPARAEAPVDDPLAVISGPDDEEGDEGDTPHIIAEDAGADEGETVTEEAPRPRARRPRRRNNRSDDNASNDSDGDDDNGGSDDDSRNRAKAEVESVGAEKVEDEIRPRRMPHRRYKIQEVIKVRQIMLVQVVKEERGNKGAALTTYLSLAGRYCVLMPNTARGGGISRKITQASDRQKLKEIASELEVPKGMGLIVRTAGAKRTKTEIRRDYEFLLRQWDQVRELTLASIAPTLIYEEGSLIKRSIRDLYGRDIDSILVEGEEAYREAKDYMKMLMPSHAKNVQAHREQTPLFSKYQVESHLSAMFNPTVQLKSGGYIVIGVTEALVAIDVNSGRSTREHSIEETALKTNLEAADEVARQLRLRDLAGLIVIDFIDMDDNRNNRAVEKRMKERLKDDRARIQIGRISAFGLLEMSRQRLRPGMIEATTAPCSHCHGTGIVRSADNVALAILREIEEEGVRAKHSEIRVSAPVEIANFLINHKRSHVIQIETRYGIDLLIEGDPAKVSPDYELHKIKGSKPVRVQEVSRAITAEAAYQSPEEDDNAEETASEAPAQQNRDQDEQRNNNNNEGGEGKRRRRGKRGGRKRRRNDDDGNQNQNQNVAAEARDDRPRSENSALGDVIETGDQEEDRQDNLVETREETAQKPKRKRPAPRKRKGEEEAAAADAPADEAVTAEAPAAEEAKPEAVAAEAAATETPAEAAPAEEATPAAEEKPKPKRKPRARKPKAAPAETSEEAKQPAEEQEPEKEPVAETPAEPAPAEAQPEPELAAAEAAPAEATPEPAPAPEPKAEEEAPKPRRTGWWS